MLANHIMCLITTETKGVHVRTYCKDEALFSGICQKHLHHYMYFAMAKNAFCTFFEIFDVVICSFLINNRKMSPCATC